MSEFSHRTVKEIKQFLKKYNSHFRIKVTKKRKAQLIDEMREGMKKEITPELKADYDKLLEKKPKAKAPAKPPAKPTKQTSKEPESFKQFKDLVDSNNKKSKKKKVEDDTLYKKEISEIKKIMASKEVKPIINRRDDEKPLTKPQEKWFAETKPKWSKLDKEINKRINDTGVEMSEPQQKIYSESLDFFEFTDY